MNLLARGARRFLHWTPVRHRVVSAVLILAIAFGSVTNTRRAWAPTAVEYAVALALVIVAVDTIVRELGVTQPPSSLAAPMSCPVFKGSGTMIGEDDCIWTKAAGEWNTQSGSTSSTSMLRFGAQKEVAPDWFVGGAFGVGQHWTPNNGGSPGQVYEGSAALKHTIGPWLFAGAVAFSSTALHIAPSGAGVTGDTNVYNGGLRLRGSYDFDFSGWYVRPRLDLDLLHTWRPDFQLSGSGPAGFGVLNLAVDGYDKTSFIATPMVELGGRVDIADKAVLWPYVAVGASFLPDTAMTTTATFNGPLAVGPVQTSSSSPNVLFDLQAGVQLYKTRGFELKAEYMLMAGDNYLGQGASVRGAYHF
jgi:hypothetical protein